MKSLSRFCLGFLFIGAALIQGCLVYKSAGRKAFEQQGPERQVPASSAIKTDQAFSADPKCIVLSEKNLTRDLQQGQKYIVQKIDPQDFFVCEKSEQSP